MTRWQEVERNARDAVIAARFHGGPPPANPWRRDTISHLRWDMAHRRAQRAADEIQRIGT